MRLRLPVRLPVPDRKRGSQAGKTVLQVLCDVLNAPTGADRTVLAVLAVLAVILLAAGTVLVTSCHVTPRRRVVAPPLTP